MKTKLILSLAISFTLFISCEKEIIIEKEVEKQYSWKTNESFSYDYKVQFNSFADSSNLYTIGLNTFSKVSPDEYDPSNLSTLHYLNWEYKINYKMPITSKVFVHAGSSHIGFYPSQNPLNGRFIVRMNEMDDTFRDFEMPKSYMSNAIAINDNMQCLIPYVVSDTTYTSGFPPTHFLLVNLKKYGEYYDLLDTINCRRLTIDRNYGSIASLHSFENDFFITLTEKTFKLSADLELKPVFDGRLLKIIKKKNIFYGITDSEIFSSTDNGDSWQLLFENVSMDLWRINYTLLENEIIGYRNSHIFHLDFHSDKIKEIQNDGLEGNQITSITHYLDQVYVTTLSGVYTRGFEDFFSYKTE